MQNWSLKKSFFLLIQPSLFLGIKTLLLWLKSTLLLKNKCFGTIIYMKTQCFKQMRLSIVWERKVLYEHALWAGGGVERVALINSLFYVR